MNITAKEMYQNLLRTNKRFISACYVILLECDQDYQEILDIIKKICDNSNGECDDFTKLLSENERRKLELLQQKMKPISKITALNQKIRSMYCLLENNFVYEMQSLFRNLIEDCTLFISTELLVNVGVIEYCENDSDKIKKLFCEKFEKQYHNPRSVWEEYERKFGNAFDSGLYVQGLYKWLSNEFVHSRRNFEEVSEGIYNPFQILLRKEFESLNDERFINSIENELRFQARDIKNLLNCTVGSIIDISCKKCLNDECYEKLQSIFYSADAQIQVISDFQNKFMKH